MLSRQERLNTNSTKVGRSKVKMGGIKQNINNRTARRRQKMHVCFFKLPNKNKTKNTTATQLVWSA